MDERVLQPVKNTQGKGYRPQNAQDYQKEGTDRVDDQRGRLEENLQQFAHDHLDNTLQGEGIRNLIHGLQGRMLLLTPAHVIQFRIQLLIGSKDTSGHHRLSHHVRTELVLLLLVLLQVEGLVTEQHSGSLNDGAKDTVESSQHHHVKEKDTHAQDKRP